MPLQLMHTRTPGICRWPSRTPYSNDTVQQRMFLSNLSEGQRRLISWLERSAGSNKKWPANPGQLNRNVSLKQA